MSNSLPVRHLGNTVWVTHCPFPPLCPSSPKLHPIYKHTCHLVSNTQWALSSTIYKHQPVGRHCLGPPPLPIMARLLTPPNYVQFINRGAVGALILSLHSDHNWQSWEGGSKKIGQIGIGTQIWLRGNDSWKVGTCYYFWRGYPDSRFNSSTFHLTNVHGIARG